MKYKIIQEDDGSLTSIAAWGHALIKYKIGNWAKPPDWLKREGYGITVFEDYESAKAYLKMYPILATDKTVKLFEVQVKGKMPLKPMCNLIEMSKNQRIEIRNRPFPKGTEFYEQVKLLKEVL